MAVQASVLLRTNQAEAIESTIGPTPVVRLRTGPPPVDCAAADTGTVVISYTFAADWSAPAAAGTKVIVAGTPISGAATSPGTLGHYRIYASNGTTCHYQGTIGQGTGDLPFDNPVITLNQTVQIGPNWTITVPNS